METRTLGQTDLEVTRLAFGGARIGEEEVTESDVGKLLNGFLDAGANFLDTSACYYDSEELIGATVSHRRDEFVLATKCGHASGLKGADWTAPTIVASVDRSLSRMRTDVIDLLQLHSCSADILRKGEVVEAVTRARDAGKVRYIGYSGDRENALEAIGMGLFATLQTSFNVVDQKALQEVLPAAVAAGMGIICKRPVANGALGKSASPYGYADPYWERSQQMRMPAGGPENAFELALRFTLSHDQIDTAIVGTRRLENARANVVLMEAGPLDEGVIQNLYDQFAKQGAAWEQLT